MKITRREAIIDIALLSISGFFLEDCSISRDSKEKSALKPDKRISNCPDYIVQVYGDDPIKITKEAIKSLGGMNKFVKEGDTVLIKPNIGFVRSPEQAANTNPSILKEIVLEVLEEKPKKVIVADYSLYNSKSAYKVSGIENVLDGLPVDLRFVSQLDFQYCDVGGIFIKEWEICRYFLEADKVINVPVLKQHSLAKLSMSMKNLMGMIGGERALFHQNLDTALVDLNLYLRPTLNIMDCYRVIFRNGPQGGGIKDVVLKKSVIAGVDSLSVDYYGAILMGYENNLPGYLVEGEKRGLGKLKRSLKKISV